MKFFQQVNDLKYFDCVCFEGVKLHSLKLKAPEDKGPKTVREDVEEVEDGMIDGMKSSEDVNESEIYYD